MSLLSFAALVMKLALRNRERLCSSKSFGSGPKNWQLRVLRDFHTQIFFLVPPMAGKFSWPLTVPKHTRSWKDWKSFVSSQVEWNGFCWISFILLSTPTNRKKLRSFRVSVTIVTKSIVRNPIGNPKFACHVNAKVCPLLSQVPKGRQRSRRQIARKCQGHWM